MRRPALLVLLTTGLALVLQRRRRASRPERDVWNQATTTPDLR